MLDICDTSESVNLILLKFFNLCIYIAAKRYDINRGTYDINMFTTKNCDTSHAVVAITVTRVIYIRFIACSYNFKTSN